MKNRDEPAFPIEINGFGQYAPAVFAGLTKREYIAALALQGLCTQSTNPRHAEGMAQQAVICADALIQALETPK